MSKEKTKLTVENVITAIRKNRGILSMAAKDLGCVRQTLHNYANRYPTVKQAIEDERESLLDLAEGSLFEQVRKGNVTAIIFTLKTLGKCRGYVERQELTGADGAPVKITIRWDGERDVS